MRVRITRYLSECIDGIQLSRFQPGQVYDVSPSLGCYLIAGEGAETVMDSSPALVLPLELAPRREWLRRRADLRAEAADRTPRRSESLAKRLGQKKVR